MKKYTILIVDDAEINREMLTDILQDEYHILQASDGLEALSCINQHGTDISLILLDIVMPNMDGFEVLAAMHKSHLIDSIPVIIISSESSTGYMEQAYELGAVEYIRRPFEVNAVHRRVRNTIVLYAKQRILEHMVTDQMLEKEKNNMMMIEILSHIVEFRNGESGMHVLNIRTITEALLRHLVQTGNPYHLTHMDIALITNASALHDIGKISIPEQILNKPGRLTPEEFEQMKQHSRIGAQMLENVPYYQDEELVKTAHDICLWHHERYDGKGYPDGLKGDDIPISAQVVSIADVYDALTSKRVYKDAYPHAVALEMILRGECGQFNPILLDCLQTIAPHLEKKLTGDTLEETNLATLEQIPRVMLTSNPLSSPTLALLEQERTKSHFYYSLTQELQFEYTYQTDLLTLSDWGASRLGLPSVIAHPLKDANLLKVIPLRSLLDILSSLRAATFECPTITKELSLATCEDGMRCQLIARPIWVSEDDQKVVGYIGKCTPAS